MDIGDHVETGQLLAEIDTPELDQELERARAQLAQAEAALGLSRITAARWTELVKTASVSEQETTEKQADLALKTAVVASARAEARRLEKLRSFARVTAPFAGVVTARNVDVGDLIVAGSGRELLHLAETRRLRVYTVRAFDAERALLLSSIEVYRKSLELTRNRRAGGLGSDLDVAQAETVLKTAEAQVVDTALQRARVQNALAVLTGKVASAFRVLERPLDQTAFVVPTGLPSELLERRPDIAAAERRMAAANATIGVAEAAFFPTVRLGASGGYQSGGFDTLFSWPSRFWAVGPSLSLPLFQGGRLRANLRQAEALYEEAVARYRQTVLAGFAEVENNLAAERLLAEEQELEMAALQASRKQVEIANNRYRSGLVTYLEVATAQNTALAIERACTRLRGQQVVTSVALIKSLGGGWEMPAG